MNNCSRIFIGLSLLSLTVLVKSQNLILNPSFEQNGLPYCEGWYDGCGSKFDTQCDSMWYCGTLIINESAPDGNNGDWCLEVYGSIPSSGSADTYVTGQSGTLVYQLKFWMDTEHFLGEVYLGPMKNRSFTDYNYLSDFAQKWKEYILLDTITTNPADTIGVRLTAGLGDFCICDVAFDQIELTVIDTLTTAVQSPDPYSFHKIFPNPFRDQFTIELHGSLGFSITVYDVNGKEIMRTRSSGDFAILDLSDEPEGVYLYQITTSDFQTLVGRGKVIKTDY